MYLIETIAAIKSGIGAILLTLIVLVNELERVLLVGLSGTVVMVDKKFAFSLSILLKYYVCTYQELCTWKSSK